MVSSKQLGEFTNIMDGNYRNTAYLLEEMACIQVNTKKMFYFKEGALTSVLSILDISLKLQCLRSLLGTALKVFEDYYHHCIIYEIVCICMCTYMNFSWERTSSFCQILEGAYVPQIVKNHGFCS